MDFDNVVWTSRRGFTVKTTQSTFGFVIQSCERFRLYVPEHDLAPALSSARSIAIVEV